MHDVQGRTSEGGEPMPRIERVAGGRLEIGGDENRTQDQQPHRASSCLFVSRDGAGLVPAPNDSRTFGSTVVHGTRKRDAIRFQVRGA